MSMSDDLKAIEAQVQEGLAKAENMDALEALRVGVLGRKGSLTAIMHTMGKVPPEERPAMGALANTVRANVDMAIKSRKEELGRALMAKRMEADAADVTLPGRTLSLGTQHLISQIREEIEDIFCGLGYTVEDGPYVETTYYNFTALNAPEDHPSRSAKDTFYVVDNQPEGQEVHVQDSSLAEADVPVAAICQNYLGNSLFMTESAYREAFGAEPQLNGLLVSLDGTDAQKIALSERLSTDSRTLSVVSTTKLVEDFSSAFTLINTVVYVVIVLAAALSFTVVFTLSNTNISERERELATIKVLGFKRPEVHRYINKETLILTGLGVAVGLPAGYALTRSLTWILKMPSLYFDTLVAWPSYVLAAVLAFAFTLLVNAMTNRALDRVDMVGALKSAE